MENNLCLCQLPLLETKLVGGNTIYICQKDVKNKCNFISYKLPEPNNKTIFGIENYDSNEDSDYDFSEESDIDEDIGSISESELLDLQQETNNIITE